MESSGNTPLERWYPSAGTTGLTQATDAFGPSSPPSSSICRADAQGHPKCRPEPSSLLSAPWNSSSSLPRVMPLVQWTSGAPESQEVMEGCDGWRRPHPEQPLGVVY